MMILYVSAAVVGRRVQADHVGELVFSFSNEFSWMTNKVARLRWLDL
eukprot:COSAG01_NODE_5550_length_4190_cov_48.559276_3_plen_47_part_00